MNDMEKIFYNTIDEQSITSCAYMKGRMKQVGDLLCVCCKYHKGEDKDKRGKYVLCSFNSLDNRIKRMIGIK